MQLKSALDIRVYPQVKSCFSFLILFEDHIDAQALGIIFYSSLSITKHILNDTWAVKLYEYQIFFDSIDGVDLGMHLLTEQNK